MSTHKYIDRICVVITVLALLMTALFLNGSCLGIQTVVDEDAQTHSDDRFFTANDLDGAWDRSQATTITLEGEKGRISGNGAYFYNGDLVISMGGYYVISGELEDGGIVVDADSSSKVWILLDGVSVSCTDDACIRVDQADKVFLTLAQGSDNILESGTEYCDEALSDGTDGVIFAHDDLTINGSGSLTVTGGWKHGIAANDDLVITGGSITVVALQDAIHVNDSLRICRASITLTGGDDGIATANEGSYFYLESGSVSLTSGDDGIHSAGDITIAGGSITLQAGDDGIHSDTAVAISGGTILMQQCYEGIEALTIDVTGGDITIYPQDDGLNANGGSSGFAGGMIGANGPGGAQEAFATALSESLETDSVIRISGGSVTVVNNTGRDADGLDSNGSIYITGGTVRISLLGDGSNSAIDCGSENGGVCQISGGTVVACGGASMAEGFDSTSSQCSVLYNAGNTAAAGTTVSLKDASGKVLLSYDVPCTFSSVVVSCPEMIQGETYQLTLGETTAEITLDATSTLVGSAQSSAFDGGAVRGGTQSMPAMGGAAGRRGMNRGSFNGEAPDMSQMPTPPDGESFDGETPDMSQMPTPPDGESFGGEAPDMSQMPTPPDGESFGGEAPDMSQMPTPPDGESFDAEALDGAEEGELTPEQTEAQATGPASLVLLGGVVLVLLAGITIALLVRH